MSNSSSTWNAAQHRLCRAVYDAAKRDSDLAPVDTPPGPNNYLMRSVGRAAAQAQGPDLKRLGLQRIPAAMVLKAMSATDAAKDYNRFTGTVARFGSMIPLNATSRGGLYCSGDIRAQMAELYHYADSNLTRDRFGKAALHNVVLPRMFLTLRPLDEIWTVNLTGSTPESLRFYDRLQEHSAVMDALRDLHYRSLFDAVLDADNNAAGRGLGLGLATNPELQGMQIPSARGYETEAGGLSWMETGNNIVLFVENERPASDLVRPVAVHVVDRDDGDSLKVRHFTPDADGDFVYLDSDPVSL